MANCPTCGRAMLSEWPHDHRTADPDAALRGAAEVLWSVAAARARDLYFAALAATASPGLDVTEDARYLAEAATHLTQHLVEERPAFYCEDLDNVQHFAAKVLAALATDRETPPGWTLKDVRE